MKIIETTHCPQCETPLQLQGIPFCTHCRFPLKLIAQKYRLEKILAQGGFATVYLAYRIGLESPRVIKVLKPEFFSVNEAITRFFREVRVTGALSEDNDHIVRIYDDFGEEESIGYYYVMEYLDGSMLKDIIRPDVGLPLALTFKIFMQLCSAMAAAHQAGIIHRDLKPENIFLVQRKKNLHFVKVIDFGIAKPLTGTMNAGLTQGAIGTPTYMAPEQCLNQTVDNRTDIYAMGIILYEMLTGSPPYRLQASQGLAAWFSHISGTPESIRTRRPDLMFSEQLDQVVLKSLAKKPEERYQSFDEFADAVRAVMPAGLDLKSVETISLESLLVPGAAGDASSTAENTAANAMAELQQAANEPSAHSPSSALSINTPSPKKETISFGTLPKADLPATAKSSASGDLKDTVMELSTDVAQQLLDAHAAGLAAEKPPEAVDLKATEAMSSSSLGLPSTIGLPANLLETETDTSMGDLLSSSRRKAGQDTADDTQTELDVSAIPEDIASQYGHSGKKSNKGIMIVVVVLLCFLGGFFAVKFLGGGDGTAPIGKEPARRPASNKKKRKVLRLPYGLALAFYKRVSRPSSKNVRWSLRGNHANHGVFDASLGKNTHSIRWKKLLKKTLKGSPAIGGGVVYATSNKTLYAWSTGKGRELWQLRVPQNITTSPSLGFGMVCFGAVDGHIYSINAANGFARWRFQTSSILSFPPVITQSVILVGTVDGKMYALRPKNGKPIWTFKTKGTLFSPAVYRGTLIFGSSARKVYALSLQSGKKLWQFRTKGSLSTFPVISKKLAFFGDSKGYIYAVARKRGRVRWRIPTRKKIKHALAYANGILYFVTGSRTLYALRVRRQKEIWRSKLKEMIRTAPHIVGKNILLGLEDGSLYVLSRRNGKARWDKKLPLGTIELFSLDQNHILAGSSKRLLLLQ